MNTTPNFDKEPKATINPYRNAAALIVLRILWDIHPYSWISRRKIKKLENRYPAQKAVILCNGPSLNRVNFDNLAARGIFIFGLNKINLLFEKTDFRPTVIVAVNPYVIEQNAEFYNKTELPLFLDSNGKRWVKFRDNVHFIHSASGCVGFARDCSISINQGHTVTYVAMQLAFYMGFKEVAIVGCDHSFATKGPANKTVIAEKNDLNHFDQNYFAQGVKWQLPDITASELHYELARDTFERHNRKIVNCTDGGKLEVFTRQPIDEFLNTK